MKIDRISYQKIFPTGMAYLNHKIGVEVSLDAPSDDPDEAYKFAKSMVERWNTESNPGMATAMEYMNVAPVPVRLVEKHDPMDDAEFIELKKTLDTFANKEQALAYLQSTVWKFSIEAKNYLNSKTFTNGKDTKKTK